MWVDGDHFWLPVVCSSPEKAWLAKLHTKIWKIKHGPTSPFRIIAQHDLRHMPQLKGGSPRSAIPTREGNWTAH